MSDAVKENPDVKILKNHIEDAVRLLAVVKRKACLTLLCALAEGQYTVTELSKRAGLSQPTTSQCLHKMLDLDLLSVHKVTTTNYYSISSPLVLKFLAQLNDLFRAEQSGLKRANPAKKAKPEKLSL